MNKELIELAFKEDIPTVDITTTSLKVREKFGMAQLIAKQDLILSGRDLFQESVHFCDPKLDLRWQFQDGDAVLSGQVVAQISGNLIQLIQAERVALNFLGYLSGIATGTREFVNACEGTNTKILDTRKTLPLYRQACKQAVLHGGGTNHRMNLSDGILIKENHINIAGSLEKAIESASQNSELPIEIETKNMEEVKKAVSLGANRIMLDNMTNDEMTACLAEIPAEIETEASGNMTLDRIASVAALGVDFISVGALTHSSKNADLSLIFDWS